MATKSKRLARLLRRPTPTEMSYEDIAKILEDFGWMERRGTGSHRSWSKPGYDRLTIKVKGNGDVDPGAIREIANLVRAGQM